MADVEFMLTGDLGSMEFPAVLETLGTAYQLLLDVQDQVLGQRAGAVRWTLDGIRGGSAVAILHADPVDGVPEDQLSEVVHAFSQGTAELAAGADTAPSSFSDAALTTYRELGRRLRTGAVGDLVTIANGSLVTVSALSPDPPAVNFLDQETTVESSVTGTLDALNVHGKREATLWTDLDRVRVRVTFPEALYSDVHAALRQRVEMFGRIVEDSQGRPKRIALRQVRAFRDLPDAPRLDSLVGSAPNLTEGRSPAEWLRDRRHEIGLG